MPLTSKDDVRNQLLDDVYGSADLSQAMPRYKFPVADIIRMWVRRSRSRSSLAELNDHELADIGLSRGQARFESGKPFWMP
jgi:uncharacterized protein YjiS (DUF1127 family)